jgi:putative ABC transport system permease protein
MQDYIEGDLMEVYEARKVKSGKLKAEVRFIVDVLLLFRPGIIRPLGGYQNLNNYGMYKSYFKISWRNLVKNKGYSSINIGGLAVGMTVAIFISLWIYDELSFNQYHKNYNDIAQVWGGGTNPETSIIQGSTVLQFPVGAVLKNNYSQFFKHVVMVWWPGDYTLSTNELKFNRRGQFMEEAALEMLTLSMLEGSYKSLDKPNSIVLSKSTAESIFGTEDPINKILRINSDMEVEVTGVYEDIPKNNRFSELQFIAPWSLWLSANDGMKGKETDWDSHSFQVYVQLQPNTNIEAANAGISDLYYKNVPKDYFQTMVKDKPFVQLIPMSLWHLYSEFENGKPTGGYISIVWLFGIIGTFVLLLACINFINLSTARSERRAREVGVRKAIGSKKRQLIAQFLSESFMIVMFAFIMSVMFIMLFQDLFNKLADKNIILPFSNPIFWLIVLIFLVLISFVAGIYPAFYLSSFQPSKVLKGVSRVGRYGALPRKILVVTQFTVSVVLIIGTLIVYQQIQFAQDRPIGYERKKLITIPMSDPNYKGKYNVLRTELLNTGVVSQVTTSSNPLTAVWNLSSGYEWIGKRPNLDANFAICNVTVDYGKTINWGLVEGRDFSREFSTDSLNSIIINEAAVDYMGLYDPVGKEINNIDEFGHVIWTRTIIGVVKDMVMESPYQSVKPTLYYYYKNASNLLHIRIDSSNSVADALPIIKTALANVVPTALFEYKFVDDEYTHKFNKEIQVGRLSGIFSILAILISCLGLFGLASFVAEQRTKEIGIRKVVGASIFNLWKMLSKDFVILVIISSLIAIPIAFYFLSDWLTNYEYRTTISWWIFIMTGAGALLITLATVSYQAIKAASMNPVRSLRTE